MSKFILSCTTCALRGNGDEVADTFKYAPPAGFKYWGTAGPVLWTPYIAPWLDAEKIVNLPTAKRTINLRFGEIEESKPLGLTTYQTRGAMREIKLRRLAAEELKR